MARLITSGFELAADSTTESTSAPDGQSQGATSVTSVTNVRTGARALRLNPTAGIAYRLWSLTHTLGVTYYSRVYIYVATRPAADFTILSAGSSGIEVRMTSTGTLYLQGFSAQVGSASSVIPLNTWTMIEFSYTVGTGSVDGAEFRVSGVSIASTTNQNWTDTLPISFRISSNSLSGTCDIYFDDLAVNDSTGGSQNTWPGEGKIVLLKPTADTAVGTGWTLGTGTAISAGSGSTAVKNTPPVGVADLTAGSDTKQIRNATSNANVNYDATMATYTAAGIGSSDIITVIVPIVSTAAPVTTSSKQGTVGVVSNPAITNIALGAGGTSGAFWSGVAAGTYPTGWKWSYGTITYNSTVTKGTAPVMRITQVTSSTRIAIVDAMGIYVEYFTPFAYTESATIASVSSVGTGAYSMLNAVAVTGDVINDATRAAGVQGDGL